MMETMSGSCTRRQGYVCVQGFKRWIYKGEHEMKELEGTELTSGRKNKKKK